MFWKTLRSLFKKYFIAGTLVLVPVALTIWVLKTIIVWADDFIASLLPATIQPSFLGSERIPGAGLVLTIAAILIVGVFTRLYLGRKLFALGDYIISKIPFGNTIYSTLKQILATAFTPGSEKFKGVCLVEFPRKGSFALAFITGTVAANLSPSSDVPHLTVFVPTTPNPTSGFMLILPESEVRVLDLSIEDASKIIISGGLLGS